MTGTKFESEFCEILKEFGYWALNIPKNKSGAQPFDVIAIHGTAMFAVDCKVCSRASFPMTRIEDNQWTAFQMANERTNASIGIMAFYNGDIYFLPYGLLCDARSAGVKSIKLTRLNVWLYKRDIKECLGRELK